MKGSSGHTLVLSAASRWRVGHDFSKQAYSGGSALAMDQRPPVENVASLVNGLLIHVVVSHRHLHVTVA